MECDGDGRKVACIGGCMGVVSFKGALSGVAWGLKEVGFEGLKGTQVFK